MLFQLIDLINYLQCDILIVTDADLDVELLICISICIYFTSLLLLHPEFFPAVPYHGTYSWINQNASYILLDGRLTGNGFLNEPVMHSLVKDPKLCNHLLLLMLLFFQHTWQPLLHSFSAWLLLIFLPCFIFIYYLSFELFFYIFKRHSQFFQQFKCFFIGTCSCYKSDIHTGNFIYLININFRENDLLSNTQCIITTAIK